MSEEKTLFEILTDENDTENFVLQDQSGAETEFEQIATIPMQEEIYCILRPLNLPEGVHFEEDEAIVFKLENAGGEDNLVPVEDEGLAQLVFEEYYKLCDSEEEQE